MRIKTPHGTFAVSRRATWGFSVVQARRECTHHHKRLAIGDYAIVEHRKQPWCREHVGFAWCQHVATYDLEGTEVPLRSTTVGGAK